MCTAKPYNWYMEFIEATAFTKYVYNYLTIDDLSKSETQNIPAHVLRQIAEEIKNV